MAIRASAALPRLIKTATYLRWVEAARAHPLRQPKHAPQQSARRSETHPKHALCRACSERLLNRSPRRRARKHHGSSRTLRKQQKPPLLSRIRRFGRRSSAESRLRPGLPRDRTPTAHGPQTRAAVDRRRERRVVTVSGRGGRSRLARRRCSGPPTGIRCASCSAARARPARSSMTRYPTHGAFERG